MKIKTTKWGKTTGRRKVKIQVDYWDTWNLDSTLAQIIYPCLLQLRATKHGIPGEFAEVGGASYEAQQSFDFYNDENGELFNQRCNEWDLVLDKMIWAFQQITEGNYEEKYHHGVGEYDWKESDKLYPNPITGKMEKTFQMIDKNPNDHWYDYVGVQEHNRRIQEGLDLFAKYFRDLWD
jgi:hypothetical protein